MPLVTSPAHTTPPHAQTPADAAVEAALHQAWQASARAEAEHAAQEAAKRAQSAAPKKSSSLYLQPDENYDQAARLRSLMASYNAGGAIAGGNIAGSPGATTVVVPARGTPAGTVNTGSPAAVTASTSFVSQPVVRVTHSQNAAAQAHVLTPKAAPQQARDVSRNGAGDVAKSAGPSLDPRESGKQVGPTDARAAELLAASAKHAANGLTPHDAIAEPLACNVPVIAITSGKGGVGKSSIAVNIASCLAQMRIRTTLIDADPGLANADLLCGISPTTRLDSVLAAGGARRSMSTIAVQTPAGFSLVPGSAGLARMADLGPAERVALLSAMSELETSNDVLMVDTGAGLSESVLAFVKHADFAIVIATPEPTSIADAYAMIKLLHAAKKPEPAGVRAAAGALPKRGGVFLVINQAATQAEAMQVYQRITLTTQRFLGTAPELLGWIVHDDAMRAAVRARTPITAYQPQAHASLQLHKLAAEIAMRAGVGEVQSHASQRTSGIRGFFAKVLGK